MRTRSWLAWGTLLGLSVAIEQGWLNDPEHPWAMALTVAALLVYGIAPEKERP